MSTKIQQFGAFLRETADVDFDTLLNGVIKAGTNFNRVMNADDLYEPVFTTLLTVAESMEKNDTSILARYAQEIGMRRAQDGFTLREMLAAASALRDHIWRRLHVFLRDRPPWPVETVRRLEDFNYIYYDHYSSSVGTALEVARAELTTRAEQLEEQRAVIRELGVPVMPVHEGVLVLPLVGTVDSQRAVQIMERLLEAITRHQANMVILDITGVPTVDTSVANYILQMARAVRLIGAHIILVGVGAEIAQTIVQLGVELTGMTTRANLQEGIAYAYQQLGYNVV